MKHKGNIDLEGNDIVDVGALLPTSASITVFDDENFDLIYLYEDGTSATKRMTASNMATAFHNITAGLRSAETSSFVTSNLGSGDQTLSASRKVNMNANDLTVESSTGNMAAYFTADGVFVVGSGDSQGDGAAIELREHPTNGVNYVQLKAPNALTASTTYTLPSADGTSGQVLQTNGTGTMSWVTAGGGGTPLASADQTLTADRLIDTNGNDLTIELDNTGTADVFKVVDQTHDLFEVNTNTSGTLFSVSDVSGLPTFESVDDGSMRLPKILTAAPTGTATEGTMQLAIVAGTSYLYVYIDGGWKKTTLA